MTPHARPSERLRASPSFVQALTLDGRPYVAKETEPYIQFWLSERERVLLAQFSVRGGRTRAEAQAGYFRARGLAPAAAERQRVARAIEGMQAAGVLMRADDDTSRYDARIVRDYVAHRPFPPAVAQAIARAARIGERTEVLDLAGGPGDLALALARHSKQVSLMELSRGFLAAARRRAREQGVPLATLHDSCNRLVYRDEPWDVVTVSQALHWLDDVAVCRGLVRHLRAGGHFFVVHSAIDLPERHPLAWLLGHDSVLGRKERVPFAAEVQPLVRRLSLLFEALDASPVQRVDLHEAGPGGRRAPLALERVSLFTQQRPFGPGYARGFLTPRHVALTGLSPEDFWADFDARCAGRPAAAFEGTHRWALLHFRRGAAGTPVDVAALPEQPLPYDGARDA